MVLKTCGKGWPHIAIGATFNVNTLSPPIEPQYRILMKEIVLPDETPKSTAITEHPDIPMGMICQIIPFMTSTLFGFNSCTDKDALEFIDCEWEPVTEIAGSAAYEACGFKDVKMEHEL
jgi:hypothetical protein